MSGYIVTARKWRPMTFEDVAAQSHVTVTLRNAIVTRHLAHAYLFSGPRGVGKTTTARLLAKAVNCRNPKDHNPDNECDICREITEGRSFDVLEIDGASNRGVDEIRNLRESARYPPAQATHKVYIIDEVHMLTKEAFNALLKTLEEPPPHILFILATTEIHKVPATIVSRCQRFDFRRIAVDEIVANLKKVAREEGIEIDDESLLLIARKGDGSLRDSQSLFDQVVSLCGRQVTQQEIRQALHIVDQELFFRLTDLIKRKDTKGGILLVEEIIQRGHDIKEFLAGLLEHFRNILIHKTTGSASLIETSDVYKKRLAEEAEFFSTADLLRLIRLANGTEAAIRWSAQPRFKLEADIIQMIGMHSAPEVGDLLRRIEELKKKLNDAVIAPGSSSQAAPVERAVPVHPVPLGQGARTADRGEIGKSASLPERESLRSAVLSPEGVMARWPEYISEVRRRRISLGAVLDSVSLLGVVNGVVRIGCTNDFEASSLSRNRQLLVDIMQTLFGAPARLEFLIAPQGSPGYAPESGDPAPASPTQAEHPVVKALMNELGAEPL
jgi:DNA polymerase-3 subunit gamma/tau